MTQIETNALRIERTLRAPIDKVRNALTQGDMIAKWFAPGPMRAEVNSYDCKPGGQYEIAMIGPSPETGEEGTHTCTGTFEEVTDDRIAMSFNWTEEPLPNETKLIFELAEVEGGTRLVLIHEGFPNKEAADMHTQGWEACLEKLTETL